MASGIESNDSLFYTSRELPWHGMGTPVQEAPTSERALELAGLGWRVTQVPVYYGENLEAGYGLALAGEYLANVRSDTHDLLGVVSKQYRIIQNDEALEFTDALLGEGVRYETAGSLFGGKRIWLLARLEPTSLLGEQVHPYLLFSNSHDGSNAAKVAITPVRVVCNNTLLAALSGASRTWTCAHRGDVRSKLEAARMTLANAEAYMKALRLTAEEYDRLVLTSAQVAEYVEELFPVAEDATPRTINNMAALRADFWARFNAPDLQPMGLTGYRLFSAVADFASHRKPLQTRDGWRDRQLAKQIDGDPVVARAQLLLKQFQAISGGVANGK